MSEDNALGKCEGDQKVSPEAYTVIDMECSNQDSSCETETITSCGKGKPQCFTKLDESTTFSGVKFTKVIAPPPIVPDYPTKLTFSLVNEEGFTKELNLEDFLAGDEANEIDKRIDNTTAVGKIAKENWRSRLVGHYEITSGTQFDMNINLFYGNGTVFANSNTTAKIIFFD